MFKQLLNKKLVKNEKGLTLIELLAVVVILAIIAAIAIPAIGGIIENSRYKAVKADAMNIISASNIYFTDNPDKTEVEVGVLKTDGYLDTLGKFEINASNKVAKDSDGNKISSVAIKYSGDKTITFSSATIKNINDDTQKGNTTGGKTVPTTTTGP